MLDLARAVHVIDAEVRSSATSGEVFALLAEGRRWLDWGAWTGSALELPGEGAPEGPGAVRSFTSRTYGRTVVSRERVLEVVAGRRVRYELVSGLPLRNCRSQVDLTSDGTGTLIRWHSTFDGAAGGSGWRYRRALGWFIADAATRLARYAELRAAA